MLFRIVFTTVTLVLLLLFLLAAITWKDKAQAQRIHRYHFECIGAGFTSQQCSFLGDMLRRYGVN